MHPKVLRMQVSEGDEGEEKETDPSGIGKIWIFLVILLATGVGTGKKIGRETGIKKSTKLYHSYNTKNFTKFWYRFFRETGNFCKTGSRRTRF